MRKVYFDETGADKKNCAVGVIVSDAEVILAGTTLYMMPSKEKNSEYQRYAKEYDIHFIFEDHVPKIDFYTVPRFDIMAVDSEGGYIGTIGQPTDLADNGPIGYVDEQKNCYLIARNGEEFLKNAKNWKDNLKLYNGLAFYESRQDAEKELEFVHIEEWE